jgi:hypothetical protein
MIRRIATFLFAISVVFSVAPTGFGQSPKNLGFGMNGGRICEIARLNLDSFQPFAEVVLPTLR